jgi:hypothetical protein
MTREITTQTQQQTPTTSLLSRESILQRKCESCGQHTIAGGDCGECAKKKSGLQRKLAIGASNDPLELEADRVADQVMAAPAHLAISGAPLRIQRVTEQAIGNTDMVAPASVDRVLSSSGRRLEPSLQRDMGQRFGHDFSRVRVHTGAEAERSARDVSANAYTVGHNIVFGAGQFAPGTHEGRRLIAHELTHVVQQTGVKGIDANQRGERVTINPVTDILQRQPKRGGAAGCGICLNDSTNDPTGSKTAGQIAHAEIQAAFTATNPNIVAEHPIPVVEAGKVAPFIPKIDLSYDTSEHGQKIKNIGEIKPLDDAGKQVGIARKQLQDYARELRANPELKYDEVFRMRDAPTTPLPFFNPAHPPGCPPQIIYVKLTEPGIYQYYCEPPFSKLVKDPRCRCRKTEEKEKRKVKEVAKPEQEQEKEKNKTPQQQPKSEEKQQPEVQDDDSILPEVVTGVGAAAAATAATRAYLRKRAIEQAERRAAQLAWRELAEAAAARRAAQAAGKGVAGKVAGKAVVHAEIAAAAAAIIFYSDRVEAKPGPGSSAIESLYKVMTTNGTPPSPEMKQLLESDPLLKQLAEEAAGSGDGSQLQEEMIRRTLELIRANPDVFTPEDLEFLMQYSDTAKTTGQSPQTVEQLRKAINAAKAGKLGADTAKADEGSKATDAENKKTSSTEEVKLVEEIKKDEKLKKIYDVVFGSKGFKVDKETLKRFLALKAKLDAHPELVDVTIKNTLKDNITDPIKQLIEPIEQVLAEAEKQKTEPKKDTPTVADQPTTTTQIDPKKDEKAERQKDVVATGPTDAEKATATAVEFWKHFDAKDISARKTKHDGKATEKLPATISVPLTWEKQTAQGKRVYKISMHGTLEKKLDKFDTSVFDSVGIYNFSSPSKIVKSEKGDEPIYFTDADTKRSLTWGFWKPKRDPKTTPKKK